VWGAPSAPTNGENIHASSATLTIAQAVGATAANAAHPGVASSSGQSDRSEPHAAAPSAMRSRLDTVPLSHAITLFRSSSSAMASLARASARRPASDDESKNAIGARSGGS